MLTKGDMLFLIAIQYREQIEGQLIMPIPFLPDRARRDLMDGKEPFETRPENLSVLKNSLDRIDARSRKQHG
jgi:hypothetical protein